MKKIMAGATRPWKWMLIGTFMLVAGLALYLFDGPTWSALNWLPFLSIGMILNKEGIINAAKGHQALFFDTLEKSPPAEIIKQVCMEVDSNSREETYNWLGQLPRVKEFLDERQIEAISAYKYTITNKKWESTFAVSADDFRFDSLGLINPRIRSAAISHPKHFLSLLVDLLNGIFATACYDGQNMCDTDHPIAGGVQSNKETHALSADYYGTAITALQNMKGDKGDYLYLGGPYLLIVSPSKWKTAWDIVSKEKDAYGGDNAYYNTGDVIALPGLSANYWFVVCPNEEIKPFIKQNVAVEEIEGMENMISRTEGNVQFLVDFSEAFMKDNVLYGTKSRYNLGYGLYHTIFGSTGAV